MLETMYRHALLGVANAEPVRRLVERYGLRLGVRRFVAGEDLATALDVLEELEGSGKRTIFDLLGEFVTDVEQAERMTARIIATLEGMAGREVSNRMSVKPTQLGLAIDFEVALANALRVAERARALGSHVCLDMENHPYVDGTLDLLERLRAAGHTHVSTVLQSYLRRSRDDLERLLELDPPPEVRIVKGAYRESEDVAFQDKPTVDAEFRELVFRLLDAGVKANVATHDERILREVGAYVKGAGLDPERYEFQLLYGVRIQLQDALVEEGYPVRIYVPYGEDWYGYFSRRLAERPANLAFVARGMFG